MPLEKTIFYTFQFHWEIHHAIYIVNCTDIVNKYSHEQHEQLKDVDAITCVPLQCR